MNRVSKQLLFIAEQLNDIETNSIRTGSAIRTAGFFSKLFSKGMNQESKDAIQETLQLLTDDNCVPTIAMLMKGKVKDISTLMKPLRKTKETNETYDAFMKFFKECYDKLPKSVINKSKDIEDIELEKELKEDKFLQGIVRQFAQQINKLKDYVKNAEIKAGQATDTWEDAWKGWGGFTEAE